MSLFHFHWERYGAGSASGVLRRAGRRAKTAPAHAVQCRWQPTAAVGCSDMPACQLSVQSHGQNHAGGRCEEVQPTICRGAPGPALPPGQGQGLSCSALLWCSLTLSTVCMSGLQYKDIEELQGVQRRAKKMVKGLEGKMYMKNT